MDFEINLKEFHNRTIESIPEWMEEMRGPLMNPDIFGGHFSDTISQFVDKGVCPTLLHGAFFNTFANRPVSKEAVITTPGQYQTVLRAIQNKDSNISAQSWLSELIQNAVDIGATNLDIEISDSELKFSHNGMNEGGELFRPDQLSFLFLMNSTTKGGDFTKIGQFGVGFKYWYSHFDKFSVIVSDGEFVHTLTINRDFNPEFTIYQCKKEEGFKRTEFRFEEPLKPDEWGAFLDKNDVFGERVYKSLPFIQSRVEGDFQIELITPTMSSRFFCNVVKSEEVADGNFVLDEIHWGRDGGEDESSQTLNRVSASLNSLGQADERAHELFIGYVVGEYVESATAQKKAENTEGQDVFDIARGLANDSLNASRINLLLTPDEQFGFPSNLFIANHPDSRFSAPFIADGPWQLERDRVTLAMDSLNNTRSWNRIVARYVDRLYSRFMQYCLSSSDNLGYSASEMLQLVNRPFGEKVEYEKGASALTYQEYMSPLDLDNRFFHNLSNDFRDENGDSEDLPNRICHISETFGLVPENRELILGTADESLVSLWEELVEAEDSEARAWLENALHERLAKVEIADGAHVPINISVSSYDKYDDLELPPAICRNIGDGIPESIRNLFQSPQEPEEEEEEDEEEAETYDHQLRKEQLEQFDDVVIDYDENLSFATDGETQIVEVGQTNDDGLTVRGALQILEVALDRTLLRFLHRTGNPPEHIRHMGRSKSSIFPSPLSFSTAMEWLVKTAYENSLDCAALSTNDCEFITWLEENKPNKLIWSNAILLPPGGDEESPPILLILPPKGHLLAVVIGFGGRRHLMSLHQSVEDTPHIAKFSDKSPEIHRWGRELDGEVFAIPEEFPSIEEFIHPWLEGEQEVEDSADDEDDETQDAPNLRSPKLECEDWAWSDLSPQGETGWVWPKVSLDDLDEEEVKGAVVKLLTPVFIDGLHLRKGHHVNGVHSGYRTRSAAGNNTIKRLPIHHQPNGPRVKSNAVRVSYLEFGQLSHIKNQDLLFASVHHDGTRYFPYGTQGTNSRAWVSNSTPDILKIHGQIRILGLMAKIAEFTSLHSRDVIEEALALHQLQHLNHKLEKLNLKMTRDNHIYDVPLVRGGTSTTNPILAIGLIGVHIPFDKPDGDYYIGDDNQARLRSSSRFESLRHNRLVGYSERGYDCPYRGGGGFKAIRDYHMNDIWLPILLDREPDGTLPERFERAFELGIIPVPIYDKYEMRELLSYKKTNLWRDLDRAGYDTDSDRWSFRRGIGRMLHILVEGNQEDVDFCLDWLEELLIQGLFQNDGTWADKRGPFNDALPGFDELEIDPRPILRSAIDGREEDYIHILLVVDNDDDTDEWREFLRKCLTNLDPQRALGDHGDSIYLREFVKDEESGHYISQRSNVHLKNLSEKDEDEYTFITTELSHFSSKIIKLEDRLFHAPSEQSFQVFSGLADLGGNEVTQLWLHTALTGVDFDTATQVQKPDIFDYVDEFFNTLTPHENNKKWASIQHSWHPFSLGDEPIYPVFAGDGSLALLFEPKGEVLNIRIRNPRDHTQLSSREHELIADLLLQVLHGPGIELELDEIRRAVEMSPIDSPWLWHPELNIDSTDLHKLDFILRKCAEELEFEDFINALEDLKVTGLEERLQALEQQYREGDSNLSDKWHILHELYNGVPSLLPKRRFIGINDPNNPLSVRYRISIGHRMVCQMPITDTYGGGWRFTPHVAYSLGDTLLVNSNEQGWFNGYAMNQDSGEWYDFHPDAYASFKDALFEDWDDAKNGDGFIHVNDSFVNQDGVSFKGKFHRYHLIHIVASLSVFIEE